MPLAVVSVPNGLPVTSTPVLHGLPVVVAANGFGIGVTPVASGGLGVFDTGGTLFGPPVIPANTSPPVIAPTPTPVVGNTLTLSSLGTWSGTMATYTFQWKRGGVNIGGATGGTYLLVTADIAANITVTVTATNPAGSASATSAAVGPVTVAAPVNSGLPVITGSTVEGGVLTTTTGTWSGSPTYAYQWKRGVTNVGTSVNTYTTVAGDVGSSITVVVTATNAGGNASATSAAVGPITALGTSISTPTIDLVATSDPGSSSVDNITNDNTPAFDVICVTTPLVGDVIEIAKDGVTVASATLTSGDIAGSTVPGLGVATVADGTYTFTARHSRGADVSAYSAGLSVTIDTALPVLTSPAGVQNGGTPGQADLSVTTDTGQGSIYWVVQAAVTAAPSAAQIILGQGSDSLNRPAGWAGNFTVATSGAKTASASGFSVTGNHKAYFTQTDMAGNIAAVSASAQWTQTMAGFTANGIGGFDASTTSLTNSTLAGSIPAGKKGLVSFWVKMLGGAGTDRYVFNITTSTTIKLWCYITTANVVTITGRKSIDATTALAMTSASASTPFTPPPTGWIHVAMWWDLSLASPTNSGQIWVNGALNMSGTKTFVDADIGYNMNSMHIGTNAAAGLKFFGSMSELYVNLHETLDLSVPANLAKFYSGGLPVSLGATGTLPTGTQPEFYLGDDNNNTNWQTNNGSKGNFTVTGALTSVTGPP